MGEVEKTRAINLDPKRLRLLITKSNKTRQWWCERWVSSACLSVSFLCLFQRFVTRKSTTILWHSLDFIPLFLCSRICWFRIILALCWHTALCFLSFSDWQIFNHLVIADIHGREKQELDIPDTLMSPCSGYDIIKALSNEQMQYSAQATEQHCISSRGHGSLIASGKRSTCCHKVTEK